MELKGFQSTNNVSFRSTISMLAFQCLFYGVVLILIYWILTLNYTMLLISLAITVAQMGVKS
jgi:hypothetical protein